MKLKQLRLKNFKSYEKEVINFPTGVIAIAGENEAGKSTILDAIGFLMFDYKKYSNVQQMVRQGERSGHVELIFEGNDERDYKIVRGVGKQLYQIVDVETNQVICDNATTSKEWLINHFGFSSMNEMTNFFKNAVGVPQGRITSDFLLSETNRIEVFSPILRTDEYKRAFRNSREIPSLIDSKINKENETIRNIEGRLEQYKDLDKEIIKISEELELIEKELQTLRKEKEDKTNKYNKLKEIGLKIQNYRKEIIIVQKDLQQNEDNKIKKQDELQKAQQAKAVVLKTKKAYEKTLELEEKRKILEEKRKEENKLKETINALTVNVEKHKEQLKSNEKELSKITKAEEDNKSLLKLKDEFEKNKQLITNLNQKNLQKAKLIGNLTYQKEQLTEKLKEKEKLKPKVELEKELDKLLEEKKALEKDQQTISDKVSHLEGLIESLTNDMKRAKDKTCPFFDKQCPIVPTTFQDYFKPLIEKYNDQRNQLLKGKAEITNKLNTLENRIKEIEKNRGFIRTYQDLEKVIIPSLKNKIKDLEQEISQFDGIEKKIADLEERQNILEPKVQVFITNEKLIVGKKEVITIVNNLRSTIDDLEKSINTLKDNLSAFKDVDTKLTSISKEIESLKEDYNKYLKNENLAEKVPFIEEDIKSLEQKKVAITKKLFGLSQNLENLVKEFNDDEFNNLEQQIKELHQKEGTKNEKKRNLEQKLSKLTEDKQKKKSLEKELQGHLSAKTELEKDKTLVTFMRDIFNRAGPKIIDIYTRQITRKADEIFKSMTNDYSRELIWTSTFAIQTRHKGETEEFIQFSGGKQMAAALAVRMALLQLSNFKFAFLDEPTQNLDENRRNRFADTLEYIKGFNQLFVISHDDTFDRTVENIIRIKKDKNNISRVVKGRI